MEPSNRAFLYVFLIEDGNQNKSLFQESLNGNEDYFSFCSSP